MATEVYTKAFNYICQIKVKKVVYEKPASRMQGFQLTLLLTPKLGCVGSLDEKTIGPGPYDS